MISLCLMILLILINLLRNHSALDLQSGAFFSSNQVFGPVDCKIFFFKSTLPLDEELELANSLKKARFPQRFRIAAPVFLVVGRQLRRLSFSPLCGALLLEGDVATAQQQVQKLKTWHL